MSACSVKFSQGGRDFRLTMFKPDKKKKLTEKTGVATVSMTGTSGVGVSLEINYKQFKRLDAFFANQTDYLTEA